MANDSPITTKPADDGVVVSWFTPVVESHAAADLTRSGGSTQTDFSGIPLDDCS